jgi:hypothetical protein
MFSIGFSDFTAGGLFGLPFVGLPLEGLPLMGLPFLGEVAVLKPGVADASVLAASSESRFAFSSFAFLQISGSLVAWPDLPQRQHIYPVTTKWDDFKRMHD